MPPVPPVAAGTARPRWSVMIPTFNCANLLRLTLKSVLSQAPGAEQMQIEVVDDCSTKDDPEAVVREVGGGRVEFYRQPQNQGVTRNFNTCVRRSRGHLVQVLHGDDLVEAGFYERMGQLVDQNPEVAFFCCRGFFIDADGNLDGLSDRMPTLERATRDVAQPFFEGCPFLAASAVIRRTFYETHGGFNETLVHTADWEMWTRAIALGGGVALNAPLVSYRFFPLNDSSRLMRTGENVRDRMRCARIFESRIPAFSMQRMREFLDRYAWNQYVRFRRLGDKEAARANLEVWWEVAPRAKAVMRYLRDKVTWRRS